MLLLDLEGRATPRCLNVTRLKSAASHRQLSQPKLALLKYLHREMKDIEPVDTGIGPLY